MDSRTAPEPVQVVLGGIESTRLWPGFGPNCQADVQAEALRFTRLSHRRNSLEHVTIRIALNHTTTYHFERPAVVHPHTVRLRPAPHTRTPIESYSLSVTPANHFINWQQDPFGNYVARLVFPEPVEELSFQVDLIADMTVINPFDFFVEDYAAQMPFGYPDELRQDLQPYLHPVPADPGIETSGDAVDQWIARRLPPELLDGTMRTVDWLVTVNQAVHDDVAYTTRMEPGVQTPGFTLSSAIGSCRDSAWLLVSVLRRFGLAARFVSGYLVQLTADMAPVDGPAGPTEDFTDLHAWAEVYIPGAGWIGLDATSGLFAGEGHIPLSCTPNPASAAPITGATEVVGVEFEFANSVRRIHEDARVTKPLDDDQWTAITALGELVDQGLAEADVRLTMGGEPTFVSAAGTAGPQWETDADGPEKRDLATRLAERLRARWAPNGLVHYGQGKWYPGEDLPRWQMTLAWRPDGKALWDAQELLDDPWSAATDQTADPGELARAIAARMGVPDEYVLPAYEDVAQAAVNEARLPWGDPPTLDPDPTGEQATSTAGRSELVDRLDAGADEPAGWVLPIFIDPETKRWATTRWQTRRAKLFLTPGTSPLGLRLPLDAIAWGEQPDIARNADGDLDRPLPEADAAEATPAVVHPISEAPRTALTIEARQGHLFCFLPPFDRLDDALVLLGAVEAAATELGAKLVLEGYPLPGDDRVRNLSVTPDPGVIEVNVHPTGSWPELVELTTTLFDDARHSGLTTEKFDLDGTHTGTGGGNHITLGGPKPADSPLLRRPDLLRSLVTYWQHHPALSYMFTGRFVGPTSQAPRVDEGLPETLYELDIAFDELAAMVADPEIEHDIAKAIAADWDFSETPEERIERQRRSQPWLTDRLLRHLLTDLTGNTHRAEFCIDKLYNPDTRTGRLGLLEMRGFEMPPHERMSLLQALLVRALVLRFWNEPYAEPLVRWGTRLHDRFLLPAFAASDLWSVLEELNAALPGADFDLAWFESFLEFRFPRLGEVQLGDVHLELRQAIEPWQVLGEEISLTGTARYVDSSVERVQVAATGLVDGRHLVFVNGVPLPMTPVVGHGWGVGSVGRADARVAGVRYRAWSPPSALHPTIGVHSPLRFDLVDARTGESLGGFRYHVLHPGGRSFDSYPVNAVEAESRRAARFEPYQTSGRLTLPRTADWGAAEFPATLDLRRFDRGRIQSPGEIEDE